MQLHAYRKGEKRVKGDMLHITTKPLAKIARPYIHNGFANAKGMFSKQLTYKIKLKQIN